MGGDSFGLDMGFLIYGEGGDARWLQSWGMDSRMGRSLLSLSECLQDALIAL